MALTFTKYSLDEAAVETISAALQDYLDTLGTERRNLQRIRITVEELLLNVMEGCGKGTEIAVAFGRQAGRQMFRMSYVGDPFDPTASAENTWADELMRSMGVYPAWSYKHRTNTLSLVLAERKKRGTIYRLAVAAAAALTLGLLGRLLPATLLLELDETLLTPLSNTFLGLMSTFSGLLIAFTICNGILGIGDSATLGKLGKQVILRFIGVSFLVCALALTVCVLVLDIPISGQGQGVAAQFGEISAIVFAILPSDPVSPFQTGNALQIVVIALLVGIGIMVIGERGSRLRGLVEEGTTLMQRLLSGITFLIPLFVFVMLLRQFWLGDPSLLLSIWKPVVITLGMELFLSMVFCLWSSFRLRCPPLTLLKKVLPPFLIALTTASSVSALALSMDTCERKLGIERNTVSFAYPLGSVIFMPSSIVYYATLVCCFTQVYHVEIGAGWLVMAFITVTLLMIAMPPIPGAGIMVCTVLFAKLGLPAEAMVMAAAADVVVDFLDTGFNVLHLLLQLAGDAGALGKLDRGVLLDGAETMKG